MSVLHMNAHINNYLLSEIQHYISKHVLRHKKSTLGEMELLQYRYLKSLDNYFVYPRLTGKRVWLLQSDCSVTVYDANWLHLVGEKIAHKTDVIGIFSGSATETGTYVITDVFLNNGNTLVSLEYADRLDSLRWALSSTVKIISSEIDEMYQDRKVSSIFQTNILYKTQDDIHFRIQCLYYPSSINDRNFPDGVVFQHRKISQIKDIPKIIVPHQEVFVYPADPEKTFS